MTITLWCALAEFPIADHRCDSLFPTAQTQGDDDSQLQQALQKSRDLEGLNINLEIFPVVPKAAEDLFDHDKFYNKLLSEMGQEEIEKGEASELWELYEEIKNKYAKQRAARALPMRFGGAEGMV